MSIIRSAPSFDLCQFDKRMLPRKFKHTVSYQDFSRMHVIHTSQQAHPHVPEFVHNLDAMRLVIAQRGWHYLGHRNSRVPIELVKDWRQLKVLVDAAADREFNFSADCPKYQLEQHRRHVAVVKRLGYLELQAAVLYRSFRLGEDSTTIGAALGLSAVSIRQILYRLVQCAAHLGFDVGPLTSKRPRPPRPPRARRLPVQTNAQRAARRQARRRARIASGRCIYCPGSASRGRQFCEGCAIRDRRRKTKWRIAARG